MDDTLAPTKTLAGNRNRSDHTRLSDLILSPRIIWLIVFIGFALRVLIAAYVRDHTWTLGDPGHTSAARNILLGNGFTPNGAPGYTYNPPGYAVFLAGAYALIGDNWLAVGFSQAAVSMLTIGLIYQLAKVMFARTAAVFAAAIAALYPYTVYHASHVMDTTLFTFLLLAAVLKIVKASRTSKNVRLDWFVLGVILGLGCLVRATMLAVASAMIIWLILTFKFRRGHQPVLFCIVGVSLVIAPWTLRNLYLTNEFILIDSKGMGNAYMGNNMLTLEYMERNVSLDRVMEDERLPKVPSGLYGKEITRFIVQEPKMFSRLLWKKLIAFWNVRINPGPVWPLPDRIALVRELVYTGAYVPLLVFAFLGIGFSILHQRETGLLVLIFSLYTLAHLLVWSSTRLRMPLDSLLAVLAGYGVLRIHYTYIVKSGSETTFRHTVV